MSPCSSSLTQRSCSFTHAPSEKNTVGGASSSAHMGSRIKLPNRNYGWDAPAQADYNEWENNPQPNGENSSQLPRAQVNVIGETRPTGGGVNPIMMENLRKTTPKRLGGGREDFQEWRWLWEDHLQVAREASPGTLSDFTVLTLLKDWLDDTNRKELETRLRHNRAMCYFEYYGELCIKYGFDPQTTNRNRWRGVQLIKDNSRMGVNAQAWARFEAELTAASSQVSYLDPEEMREHILKQIPSKLREKVLKAELKKQEEYHWVRVSIPLGDRAESVVREIGLLRRKNYREWRSENGHLVINAGDAQEKRHCWDSMVHFWGHPHCELPQSTLILGVARFSDLSRENYMRNKRSRFLIVSMGRWKAINLEGNPE